MQLGSIADEYGTQSFVNLDINALSEHTLYQIASGVH